MTANIIVWLFATICVVNSRIIDVCLNHECNFGEICARSVDGISYNCVKEKAAKASLFDNKINNREDLFNSYTPDENFEFDACISSPCGFKEICRSYPNRKYICIKELDQPNDVNLERQYFYKMQNNYQMFKNIQKNKATNLAAKSKTSAKSEKTTDLRAKFRKLSNTMKNVCSSNPCANGTKCEKSENQKGYICIDLKERNNNHELLLNEDIYAEIDELPIKKLPGLLNICFDKQANDKVGDPLDANKFYVCLNKTDYVSMSCKDDLVFNPYLNKCWENRKKITDACSSSPCLYGGKCISIGKEDYKCECPNEHSGNNCEIVGDPCSSKPCGNNGVCHKLGINKHLSYYCICENNHYGLDCDSNKKPNPCSEGDNEEAVLSDLNSVVYLKCNYDSFDFLVCKKSTNGSCNFSPLMLV